MRLSPSVSLFALTLLLSAVLGGCPTAEPDPPLPVPPGVDPTVAAVQGEARAGAVHVGEEAALFGGLASEGKPGDTMIYNRLVRFVVQGPYRSHGYIDTGGSIIDADLVRPAGQLGRDPIDDVFISHGVGWLFHADTVDVVADGSEGGAAVVEASGALVRWSFIEGAVETDEPLLPEVDVVVVVRYVLEPESWTLRIEATYLNRGFDVARVNPSLGWLASDEDLWSWAAHQGLNPEVLEDLDAIGGAGKYGEASYSFWPDEGQLRSLGIAALVSSAGISATSLGWTDVEPGDSVTFTRNLSVAPDVLTAEAERRSAQGLDLADVSGSVLDPDGAGVGGVRVWFVDGERIAGYSTTGDDGRFEASVEPGDWDLYAVGRADGDHVDMVSGAGRYGPYAHADVNARQLAVLDGTSFADELPLAAGWPVPPPVSVTAGATPVTDVEIQMEARGTLVLDVTDSDGAPLPAYAEVVGDAAVASNVPDALREHLGIEGGSRLARVWTADGHVELPAPPGTYTVSVEHSWRHERTSVEIEVPAGGSGSGAVSLDRTVPADGWLAMDSHLHAAPSNDGHLAMEHRLIACAATGVDLPVNTDHDRMADYRPLATALGLDDRLQVLPGVEVSPVVRGHFNLFPVEPDPSLINGGAEPWWEFPETQQELFDRIFATGTEDSVLQINHGRSPGMMAFAGYSPDNGQVNNEDMWSWDFNVFELMNGTGHGDVLELRDDWFSFLNAGHIDKLPTGTSDSHGRGSACGYGRTDIFLDTDDAASVTPGEVTAALMGGHIVVAGGLTLRVEGTGGAMPGDLIAGDSNEIVARVLGPAHIRPTVVRLYRNGEVVDSVDVPPDAEPGLWIEHTFEIEDAEDAWYVVEAEGASGIGGVWHGGIPYAIANAIRVDVAGDGWEAPGL